MLAPWHVIYTFIPRQFTNSNDLLQWLAANMVVSSFAIGALATPVFFLGFIDSIRTSATGSLSMQLKMFSFSHHIFHQYPRYTPGLFLLDIRIRIWTAPDGAVQVLFWFSRSKDQYVSSFLWIFERD